MCMCEWGSWGLAGHSACEGDLPWIQNVPSEAILESLILTIKGSASRPPPHGLSVSNTTVTHSHKHAHDLLHCVHRAGPSSVLAARQKWLKRCEGRTSSLAAGSDATASPPLRCYLLPPSLRGPETPVLGLIGRLATAVLGCRGGSLSEPCVGV